VQVPRRSDRRLKIETPVHEHPRNPRKPIHVTQDTPIAKPRIVMNVVRHKPRKPVRSAAEAA